MRTENLERVDRARQGDRVDGGQACARAARDDDAPVFGGEAQAVGGGRAERGGHLARGDLAAHGGAEADDENLGQGVPGGAQGRHGGPAHCAGDRRDGLIAVE